MHSHHGDDINRPTNNTANSGGPQQRGVSEPTKEFGGVDFSDAGLRAAARGWVIFPCNGKKEPLTAHGFKDATTDEQQINAWAKQFPGGLWGHALPKELLLSI